ncbi:MAG: EamA family transporter [Eubacteriales bacterium]|nr:EamA family transporter [Eubacteriales bacterium]
MWFLFALLATLSWGVADVFYKRSATDEKYSHLKTTIVVGFIMGIHAICVLIFTDIDYNFINLLYYAPVSLMYILSMTVGYLGLRYLELSVSSPVQNTSGALVCILCLLVLGQTMDALSSTAVIFMCLGVFLLGMLDHQKRKDMVDAKDKKYRVSTLAFLLPVAYCIIDAGGTFFDAFYLDDIATTPLVGVTEESIETVANTSYELTFLLVAIILFIYVVLIKKQSFTVIKQRDRACAALFETAGQLVYVYAMSGYAIVAAPMIASYSIVSVILSRIFLKEKLTRAQYFTVALVMAGIILLGISEAI